MNTVKVATLNANDAINNINAILKGIARRSKEEGGDAVLYWSYSPLISRLQYIDERKALKRLRKDIKQYGISERSVATEYDRIMAFAKRTKLA